MKPPPPDRTSIVKELEKRLLKKWADEKSLSDSPAVAKKPVIPPTTKNKNK